jgi:outer membrane lipoprotein-sorting protein
MKRIAWIAVLAVSGCLTGLRGQVHAQEITATEIIQRATDLLNGESNRAEMKMTVIRPSWSREITMKSWSLGDDYSLILITAPAKEKGQTFLKRHTDMWNWMPSINRMIKIPPSMMSQSWLGSDFTNDDLVKMNSYVNEYTHSLAGSETLQGMDCHIIELVPKPDAPVVWGKVMVWISKEDYFELKLEFYDEDGRLVNRQECSDIRQFSDRRLPSKMTMSPVDEPGRQTIIEVLDTEYNISIGESFFSQQNMKTVR